MNILFLISTGVCMFAGLFLFYFIFDDYLVLENQGTEQIILDIWEKI